MSWVLWDIITPLLLAFALGLILGWLLWRWRRKQITTDMVEAAAQSVEGAESLSADASGSQAGEGSAEKMESINAVLIAERDEAVQRANAAESSLSEAQVEILKLKTELPDDEAESAGIAASSKLSDEEIDSSEKFQNLVTLLAKEQEQRAEVDLALAEANERYELMERELAKVKDAAAESSEAELATLQEDLDLSQKVIEEKEKEYLDSVIEMEKQIEDRDERIATLETTIAQAADTTTDDDAPDASDRVDTEARATDDLQSDDSSGGPVDQSSMNPSGTDEKDADASQSADNSKPVTTEASGAEESAVSESGEEKQQPGQDNGTVTQDGLSETQSEAAVESQAPVSDGPRQAASVRKSEALISPATAAEIAVALAEEFDIDRDEDPQPVLAPVENTSVDDDRSASETTAAVGGQGAAANEETTQDAQQQEGAVEDAVAQIVQLEEDTADEDTTQVQRPQEGTGEEDVAQVAQLKEDTTNEDTVQGEQPHEGTAEEDVAQVAQLSENTTNEDTVQIEQPRESAVEDAVAQVAQLEEGTENENENRVEQSEEFPVDDTASESTPPADERSTELNVDVAAVDDEAANPDHNDLADATDQDQLRAFDRKEDNATVPDLRSSSDDANATTSATIEDTKQTSSVDEADANNAGGEESVVARKRKGNSSADSANSAKKGGVKKKPTRKKKAKKSNTNGYAPVAWEVPSRAPTENNRDQLTDIKGVGPVLEGLLHDSGIYYFKQIALLDKDGINELQEQIPQFPGRIKRDKWVSQAKTLHRQKYGVAAKNP